jgi:hypothetical protein
MDDRFHYRESNADKQAPPMAAVYRWQTIALPSVPNGATLLPTEATVGMHHMTQAKRMKAVGRFQKEHKRGKHIYLVTICWF